MSGALLLSAFVVSTCGLIYELISGTLASYLLGDSVTQFSTVIGTYLFAMGIGAYIARYIHRNHLLLFLQTELLVGFIGGTSAAVMFLLFESAVPFRLLLYSEVIAIGILVGLEIPLLMQMLKGKMEFRDLVSRVLSFDYLGALVASLLFPIVLLPELGLLRTSFLFGILNVGVALWVIALFGKGRPWTKFIAAQGVAILSLLLIGFVYSESILSFSESGIYPGKVIYSKTTPYQRIVVARQGTGVRLFLNGNLQFDSLDEYRYHEALVHVGLQQRPLPRRVLVLGGGDGMAVRELLRYPSIETIHVVDLDGEMTRLFQESPILSDLNSHALRSPKVHVMNDDAFLWLRRRHEPYDYAVVDFPDPTNYSLGKLYSTTFFRMLSRVIASDGIAVIQSTSPLFARASFWCVNQTLQDVGLETLPYHAYVPSFGEWGFILISHRSLDARNTMPLPKSLRFITREAIPNLFMFPPDMERVPSESNKLNNQILVHHYLAEWSRYTS